MKHILKNAACLLSAALLSGGLLSPAVYGYRAYDKTAQDFAALSALADAPQSESTLIVKTDGTLPDFRTLGAETTAKGPDDYYIVTFSDARTAEKNLPYAEALHGVEFAEPNCTVHAQSEEASVCAYQTWGMASMNAEAFAKDLSARDDLSEVTVAVVDSGIKADEPIFHDRLTEGKSFVSSEYTVDDYGHGTSVAGVVADCTQELPVKIMPVKVLRSDGTGTLLDAAGGVRYAAENGADIVNLSFVAETCSSTLHDAVDFVRSLGALPVISAGNYALNMDRDDCCPADYDPGFVVSGCDSKFGLYAKTCYGSTVDICAPAVDVPCTTIYGMTMPVNGTSFAAPHISAVAAMYKLYIPALSLSALEKMLIRNTKDLGDAGFDRKYGWGFPDLSALDGTHSPNPERYVQRIEIAHMPNKTTYTYKETFSADGLEVRIVYSDGTEELRTSQGVRLLGTELKTRGENKIRVQFDTIETTFPVQVNYAWWQWIVKIFLFGWLWY